jgi:hypothetical protein
MRKTVNQEGKEKVTTHTSHTSALESTAAAAPFQA